MDREPAHLWLWLTEPMSRAFADRAFELAREPTVDRLAVIYGGWGQEIVSITFACDERDLPAAGDLILRFFGSLDDA